MWSDHHLVPLLAFFDLWPKRLMFSQIIRPTQLDIRHVYNNPERRKCAAIVCFLKKITRRMCRRFHEANIVMIPCKREQHCCATLRRSQNKRNVGTCCPKSLIPILLWFHANGRNMLGPTMLHVVGHNVASVCMGLY